MTVNKFVAELSAISLPNVFNPYHDICVFSDHPASAVLRQQNLTLFLKTVLQGTTRSIWIGRDLGYRGGRRTGLAFTDEVHLASHAELYADVTLAQATHGPLIGERTAQVIWRVLEAAERPVFLWNVVPLHPHSPGNPL